MSTCFEGKPGWVIGSIHTCTCRWGHASICNSITAICCGGVNGSSVCATRPDDGRYALTPDSKVGKEDCRMVLKKNVATLNASSYQRG